MPLKLMYITNRTDVASIAESVGVDRIFIDMEYIGKDKRQEGMDTVKSYHTTDDVYKIRSVINSSEVMVRVNPLHEKSEMYPGSEREINDVISAGADCVMLPMFDTADDVNEFIKLVKKRAKTILLLETRKAVENLDEILEVSGIDEIHIGLNDLHLSYNKKFMFELLADGTVEKICKKIKAFDIPYGFGGIARIGHGMLPAEYVIAEHYRLGSTRAILSRAFCNINNMDSVSEIESLFKTEMNSIRGQERLVSSYTSDEYAINHNKVKLLVKEIVSQM